MKLKPYMLVHVREPFHGSQSDEVQYVGEVMSFVTPDDTVMIRRVPGFPGSLVELPVAWLSECDWKRCYVTYAEVRGRGSFPVDMLRYDNAVPVNFRLSDRDPLLGGQDAQIFDGMGDALLVARAKDSQYDAEGFCIERWRSFLWGIRLLETERVKGEGR